MAPPFPNVPIPKIPDKIRQLWDKLLFEGAVYLAGQLFGPAVIPPDPGERKAIEDRIKNATKKPPKGKQYKENKPVITKPKDKPKDKEDDDDAIKVDVDYKLPPKPNQAAIRSPFSSSQSHPISRLREFVRAISGQSATEQVFGGLELWPQIYTPVTFNYTADVIGTGRRQAQIEKSQKRFMAWFTKDLQEDPNPLDPSIPNPSEAPYNFFDQAALIVPEVPGDFTGPMQIVFGQQPIWDEIADTVASSSNAYVGGLRGVVWMTTAASGDTPATGGITHVVRPSGLTDLSDRTPAADYLFFENLSHKRTQTALGASEFPITVPRSFVSHTDEELDKILDKKIELLKAEQAKTSDLKLKSAFDDAIDEAMKEKEGSSIYQTIDNLPQHVSWLARVLDEVLGAYPFSITLKDADLLKLGDQEQKIRIPNIAEALAELQGFSIINHSVSELAINLLIRVLTEAGAGRMQSIKNYYLLDVLRDFAGCKTKDKITDVQFAYNPLLQIEDQEGNDEFAKFLDPQTVKVDIEEIDQNVNLAKHLNTIDNIYQLCKAYMAKPIKGDRDLFKYIKNIKNALDARDDKDGVGDDFDEFLEKYVEKGGIDTPGNTLGNKPFGRDYTQRAKATRLQNPKNPTNPKIN